MFTLTVIQFYVLCQHGILKQRNLLHKQKKENTILDFTAGNTRQSVIILNTGISIISTMLPEDIIDSIES